MPSYLTTPAMKAMLHTLTVASLALLARAMDVLPCTIGQEPDPASDNKYRWVIPELDPCQCTQLELGSLNTGTPCRPFPVTYYDDFLVSNDPEEIHQWLNCSTELNQDVNPCLSGMQPLGMEDGSIPDARINASSEYRGERYLLECLAVNARLNRTGKAWCAAVNDSSPWIQIELPSAVYVMGVITQGEAWGNVPDEWVAQYHVMYGSDGQSSLDHVTYANGTPTTFLGNVDASNDVTVTFGTALYANILRILPTDCGNHCTMRFELLGCESE